VYWVFCIGTSGEIMPDFGKELLKPSLQLLSLVDFWVPGVRFLDVSEQSELGVLKSWSLEPLRQGVLELFEVIVTGVLECAIFGILFWGVFDPPEPGVFIWAIFGVVKSESSSLFANISSESSENRSFLGVSLSWRRFSFSSEPCPVVSSAWSRISLIWSLNNELSWKIIKIFH